MLDEYVQRQMMPISRMIVFLRNERVNLLQNSQEQQCTIAKLTSLTKELQDKNEKLQSEMVATKEELTQITVLTEEMGEVQGKLNLVNAQMTALKTENESLTLQNRDLKSTKEAAYNEVFATITKLLGK